MPDKLTVYGHPHCPMVPVLRYILDASQVTYDYIDIKQDKQAQERVKQLNRGNESVPTLVFADGSHLTEPSMIELRAKLKQIGVEMISPGLRDTLAMLLFGRGRS